MARTRQTPTNPTHFGPSCKKISISLLVILVISTILLHPKPEENNHPDHHQWFPDQHQAYQHQKQHFPAQRVQFPRWYKFLADQEQFKQKKGPVKIGLVNVENSLSTEEGEILQQVHKDMIMQVKINYQSVPKHVTWRDLFPEWIEEPESDSVPGSDQRKNKCPDIPMPRFQDYQGMNAVVARLPCVTEESDGSGNSKRGYMDVYRLQVNLVVANLLVKSSRITSSLDGDDDGDAYAVFFGSCGPMIELFRCEDLLWHEGNIWIYKPNLRKLSHKILMPVGTCQLSPPLAEPGQEVWKEYAFPEKFRARREAYVTVLHSSEEYVCGAIVLGQSIVQSRTGKDLILLADKSITQKSREALQLAGWKIKQIERIRSTNAEKKAYNEYNYSKLRIWELTEYDKLMFLDSDLLVLKDLDDYFFYPQLTAVGNCRYLFNSGVLLMEPSKCTFEDLMEKTNSVVSYNGGDQGFLNEVFKWWHRFPRKVNFLKDFYNVSADDVVGKNGEQHVNPENTRALHYLGVKPWKCYRDYDCNWDIESNQRFASDSAHRRWWEVYEAMPEKLKPFCRLTEEMERSLKMNREIARKGNFSDGHWKIKVEDPRSKYV